jgi:hypothetical protein
MKGKKGGKHIGVCGRKCSLILDYKLGDAKPIWKILGKLEGTGGHLFKVGKGQRIFTKKKKEGRRGKCC